MNTYRYLVEKEGKLFLHLSHYFNPVPPKPKHQVFITLKVCLEDLSLISLPSEVPPIKILDQEAWVDHGYLSYFEIQTTEKSRAKFTIYSPKQKVDLYYDRLLDFLDRTDPGQRKIFEKEFIDLIFLHNPVFNTDGQFLYSIPNTQA